MGGKGGAVAGGFAGGWLGSKGTETFWIQSEMKGDEVVLLAQGSTLDLSVVSIGVGWILVGLGCFVGGILAYTGRWQKWAYPSGFSSGYGFALVIFGPIFFLMGVGVFLPLGWGVGKDLTVPIYLFGAVGLFSMVGFFGMWPSFMLPKWFREGRELRRQAQRAESDLRKTARQLKKEKRKR